MRTLVLAPLCVTLASCLGLSGPDCIDETRGLSVRAQLTSALPQPLPGDTGSAHVSLSEGRNAQSGATSYRDVTRFVGSGLTRSRVTAIHVHEQGTDRLLFSIPIDTTSGPPYVITQTFTRQPYAGATIWTELYELMGNERTYVDVHTLDSPNGQLRGVLRREYPNWRDFTHAYCS